MKVIEYDRSDVWPALEYEPHPLQAEIHADHTRNRLASCGRRFGKSTIGGHELVPAAIDAFTRRAYLEDTGKRDEYWIVGPEYTDSEKEFRIFWNDIKRLGLPLDKPGSYYNPESGPMVVSAFGGTFMVHAKSAKYPQNLIGEGLRGALMVEAAKLKASIWSKFVRPMLADVRGWSLWLSTPEGRNHFYEKWQWGKDPARPTWRSWRAPSWTNTHIFPKGATQRALRIFWNAVQQGEAVPPIVYDEVDPEIIAMAEDMTRERFAQEIGAEFSEFVGRVFKEFDEEVHVRDLTYDSRYPLYAACDYGWTNPFVWLLLQVDVFGNVYVIAEYRRTERDIEDIATDLETWQGGLSRKALMFYPDPASPGDSAILKKHLHIPFASDTGGELRYRLQYINQALRRRPFHLPDSHPEKRPQLFIDRSCSGLIWEMAEGYRYADTREEQKGRKPEEPIDKDNHGPEALGRFYRGHYGPPQVMDRQTRVTTAKVSR